MVIRDVLDSIKLKSEEIKSRINNKQITINGEPIQFNDLKRTIIMFMDAGEFIYNNLALFNKISFLTVEEIFSCDVPFIRNNLNGYQLLRVSKKQLFILKEVESNVDWRTIKDTLIKNFTIIGNI